MFNFDKNTFSHMPFVAYGSSPEFKAEQFCCLQVGGKWKLHHFDGENWKRINTWLPNDSTECSPTAEFIDGKWQIAPIKNKVGKLLQKLNTTMTNEVLASILDASSSLNSIP